MPAIELETETVERLDELQVEDESSYIRGRGTDAVSRGVRRTHTARVGTG